MKKFKIRTLYESLAFDQKAISDDWNFIAEDFGANPMFLQNSALPYSKLDYFVEYGKECELKLEQYKKCQLFLSKDSEHNILVTDIINLLEKEIVRNNEFLQKQKDRIQEFEELERKFRIEQNKRQKVYNNITLGFLIASIIFIIIMYIWRFYV
jgi:hypothetical protein